MQNDTGFRRLKDRAVERRADYVCAVRYMSVLSKVTEPRFLANSRAGLVRGRSAQKSHVLRLDTIARLRCPPSSASGLAIERAGGELA
jgi:hypothetical protein